MKKQQSLDSASNTYQQQQPATINNMVQDASMQCTQEPVVVNVQNQTKPQMNIDYENLSKIAETSVQCPIFDELFDQETFDLFDNVFF